LLHNVEIEVRGLPGPEAGRLKGSRSLLGLYVGLTREEMRSTQSGTYMPARVLLYQRNIESLCRDLDDVRRQVALTLRHELAHHFGFSDADMKKCWPEGA
jgi:predicted Zn-dependent protease with MMP-like domain